MRVIRFASLALQPWKNRGGATRTLLCAPEGAGLEHFDWRISIADVSSDGPFSTFPGVERTLALIDGEGMILNIDGAEERLDASARIVSFPGELIVSARLVGGPARDFNVMTRRGKFVREVREVRDGVIVAEPAAAIVAIALVDGVEFKSAAGRAKLGRFDAVVTHEALTIAGDAIVARLSPIR